MDISEAWKNRSLTNFYFGNLDKDRVLLSTGRQIQLPKDEGPPLNYFVFARAQIDEGQPFDIAVRRTFRNLKGEKPS